MYRVTLCRDRWEEYASRKGLDGQARQAAAIGVHRSIHHRVLTGEREPSAAYVLGVLRLVAGEKVARLIDDLFRTEDQTEQPAAAAQ